MWPFSKNAQIKRAFGEYVNGDVLELLQRDPPPLQPQEKHVEYVLLLLNSHTLIERAAEIISSHDGIIESITGTFITTLVGALTETSNSMEIRKKLVTELSAQLGANAVVLHGGDTCLVGMFGSNLSISYSAIIPEYKAKLLKLSSSNFGEVIEM